MRVAILSLGTAFMLLAGTALAHHGWAGYDESKPITLTGFVTDLSWENPHGLIKLRVDEGRGKTWQGTLAPVSRMEQRGLKKEALTPGVKATIVGLPSKSNPSEVKVEKITINGKTTELRR
jgi:hypothetical protein